MPDEVKKVDQHCGYPAVHPAHNWRIPKQGSPGEMSHFVCQGGLKAHG